MANELAVKVKVNLDTSQQALQQEFAKITAYAQKNPAKISVTIDKNSLKKSIEDAFGKGASQSLTSYSKKANEISKNFNKLIGNMQELNKWQKQLETTQAKTGNHSEEIGRLNKNISACKANIQDAEKALRGLNYQFDQQPRYVQTAEKLKRALAVTEATASDTKSKNNIAENLKEQTEYQEKLNSVVNEYVSHMKAASDAETKMVDAQRKGDTQNELVYMNQMNDELDKMGKSVKDYHDLLNSKNAGTGFTTPIENAYDELRKQPAVIEATTEAVDKETIAYNNLASAQQKASDSNFNKDSKVAIDNITDALKRQTDAKIAYHKALVDDKTEMAGFQYSEIDKADKELQKAKDDADALGVEWRNNKEYTDAWADSQRRLNQEIGKIDANEADKQNDKNAQQKVADQKAIATAVKEEASAYLDLQRAKSAGNQNSVADASTRSLTAGAEAARLMSEYQQKYNEDAKQTEIVTKALAEAETKRAAAKDVEAKSSEADKADKLKEEKAAIDAIIDAENKLTKARIDYNNAVKSGDTVGQKDAIDEIQRQAKALTDAAQAANALGIAWRDNKRYQDAAYANQSKINVSNANLQNAETAADDKAKAAAIREVVSATNDLTNAEIAYNNAVKSGNEENIAQRYDEIGRAVDKFNVATEVADQLGADWKNDADYVDALNSGIIKVSESTNKLIKDNELAQQSMQNYSTNAKTAVDKLKSSYDGFLPDLTNVNNAQKALEDAIVNANGKEASSLSEVTKKYQTLQSAIAEATAAAQKLRNTKINKTGFDNLSTELTKFINQNPNLSNDEKLWGRIQKLDSATKNYTGTLEENRAEMANIKATAESLGLTTETLGQKFSRLWKEHAQTAIVVGGLHLVQRGMQAVYQNVTEVDAAMTELKKVTDETDNTYNKFLNTAMQQSRELAASISDTVNATADFARLGYTLDQATELSKAAITYQHVGDGINDISEATESIISTMKAFNIEAEDSMTIVDKFNKVGNEFAISSSGIGEALTRSASALHAAGNDINQSIGMIVAANDVAQDPEQVGNALRVVALRIRGTKVELEAAGESTDGMATSTAKLRQELRALAGVEIMDTNDAFKSTYDILDQLAAKWKDLDDITKAGILEKIAGKNRANVVAGLLENWDDAKAAMEAANNSFGSAEAELDKFKNSIAGLGEQLKSAFGSLSETLLSDDLIKGVLKIGIGITDVTDSVVKLTGVLPVLATAFGTAFAVGGPKLTGFVMMPTNTLMATWNESAA